MPQTRVLSVEGQASQGASLPQWSDALTSSVARLPRSSWSDELTSQLSAGVQVFSGRIEFGLMGETVLARVATKAPHNLVLSPQVRANPDGPVVIIFQTSGSSCLAQGGSSSTLFPGDWSLLDTRLPFDQRFSTGNEHLVLSLARPSDPDILSLLPMGAARRFSGASGVSRVLHATLAEIFDQMSCNTRFGAAGLERVVAEMGWEALSEQIDAPPVAMPEDRRRLRVKGYINSHLADPDLTVEAIAGACAVSVRSLYRAFADDPAGSVSEHIWTRRLARCAADLRDVAQAHRPITDVCLSWGFSSTSHFSRLFKRQFGLTPREFRAAFAGRGEPAHLAYVSEFGNTAEEKAGSRPGPARERTVSPNESGAGAPQVPLVRATWAARGASAPAI